jgi:hypothetical protein
MIPKIQGSSSSLPEQWRMKARTAMMIKMDAITVL